MIPVGDAYGWGVFSVPMPHEVQSADPAGLPFFRLLTRDIPWRAIGLSLLLTSLVFMLMLWNGRSQPELERPTPPPLEITVMLPPPVPAPAAEIQPSPPAPQPVRPVPPPPAPVAKPEPVVKPAPVVKPEPVATLQPVVAPKPVPPKPVEIPKPTASPQPLRRSEPQPLKPAAEPLQIKARNEPLPQPVQLAQPRRQAPTAAAMPKRQTAIQVASAAALPVEPKVATYQPTPRSARTTQLPVQAAAPRSAAASASIDVQPAVQQVARRSPARSAALPRQSGASFDSPAQTTLAAVDTGLAQARYDKPRAAVSLPAQPRQQAVATGRGSDPAVAAPQAGELQAALAPRASTASAPTVNRNAVALGSGGTSEQALSGPAPTVTHTATAAETGLTAEGSYDFLDQVAPSDLDQSLMVSLNQLKTCREPGAETQLKGRLAALLSQPDLCRSGGVVFDIRNPESAYSIHIDLYNYAQREFRDRCDALRLAVQSCAARR